MTENSKEKYSVEVYEKRSDTQYDGVPKGIDFYFDDLDEALEFASNVIMKHKKFVMVGIVNNGV